MNSNDDADRLIADYLAGALDHAGEKRLFGILREDPERLRELASLVQLDGTLRSMGEEPDSNLLLRQIEARLSSDPHMVESILRRLENTPEPGIPAVRLRRIARPSAPSGSPALVWAGIAACILFVFVLLASIPGTPAPVAPPKAITVRQSPPPEAPLPPTPVKEPERPAPPKGEPSPAPRPEAPSLETPPVPPSPLPTPKPPVQAPEPPPPAGPPVAKPTVTIVAAIERLQGETRILKGAEEVPAAADMPIAMGQGVRTVGRDSSAVLKFPDGTRIELGGDSSLADVSERAGAGKRATLVHGHLTGDVSKQPAGQPFVLSTTTADATVLGTRFALSITPEGTRLEVKEGRVRLTRNSDKKSVEVAAGRFAVAGAKGEIAAKPIQEIPVAGLLLWLKADVLPPVTGAAAQWPDASPAGNHGVQPAASARATRIENAVNGLPALRFNGGDFYKLPVGFPDFTRGLTAFVVFKPAAAKEWSGLFDFGEGTEHNTVDLSIDGPTNTLVYDVHWKREKEPKNQLRAPGAATLDQWQRITVVQAGGTPGSASAATLYRNGVVTTTGTVTVPDTVARGSNLIGSGNGTVKPYFNGEIAEIILYASALGEPERQQVEQYLSRKYFRQ